MKCIETCACKSQCNLNSNRCSDPNLVWKKLSMLDGGLKDVTETDGMNIPGDVIGRLDVAAMSPRTDHK